MTTPDGRAEPTCKSPIEREGTRPSRLGYLRRDLATQCRGGTGEQLLLAVTNATAWPADNLSRKADRAVISSASAVDEPGFRDGELPDVEDPVRDHRAPSHGDHGSLRRVPIPRAEPPMLLTVVQVEAALQLGRTRTYELLRSGEIPVRRVGRLIRVSRLALEEWVAQTARD